MVDCNLKQNWNKNECKKKAGEGEFRIIIPKKDNSGNPIKPYFIEKYGNKINRIFGGSTIIPKTKGCYSPPNSKEFFCEESLMIIGIRDFDSPYANDRKKAKPLPIFNKYPAELDYEERKKQLELDHLKVKSLGKKISKELGQDTIFIEYDNIRDASMVKKKKSWKQQVPLKTGIEIYGEDFSDREKNTIKKLANSEKIKKIAGIKDHP